MEAVCAARRGSGPLHLMSHFATSTQINLFPLGSLKLVQAKVLVQRYGVLDLPTRVVNGKWLTGQGHHLHITQAMNAVN